MEPIELFYSYAHEDELLLGELIKHLSILKRQGVIREWHDRKITAGTEWKGQIDRHLDSAGVILLLVSSDFLASDYCYDVELKRALERHDKRQARVIPVILRPVHGWQDAPFGKLQAAPTDGRAITSWTNRDEAFADVARHIRSALEGLFPPPPTVGVTAADPAGDRGEGQAAPQAVCPFRGLLPYREEDAPFFFGRQDDTNELVAGRHASPVRSRPGGLRQRQILRGTAGLVPRLRADPKTVWEVVTMVPTARPLNSLVNALSPLVWPDLEDEVKRRIMPTRPPPSQGRETISP